MLVDTLSLQLAAIPPGACGEVVRITGWLPAGEGREFVPGPVGLCSVDTVGGHHRCNGGHTLIVVRSSTAAGPPVGFADDGVLLPPRLM